MKLSVESKLQADKTPTIQMGGGHTMIVTPPLNQDYWLFRVRLTEAQSIVAFPKFGTIGIGFAVEDEDWNTNLPASCDAYQIWNHIRKNKGDAKITMATGVRAIKLLQKAIEGMKH